MRCSHALDDADRPAGRVGRVATLLVAALTLVTTLSAPALAAPGWQEDGYCVGLAEKDTTTFDEVRAMIRADRAGVTGAGVGVGVIDTGVNEVAGLQGKVVDGIDLSFDSGTDELRNRDLHGHGTAMASIVASAGAYGGHGIAPGAHVVNIKAGAGTGAVDVSQVIAAIDWAVANKDSHDIDVLLLAYNTDSVQPYEVGPLSHAVESAWHNGIVVVVAGGNEGRSVAQLGNPATNPYVIAVGAGQYFHAKGKTYYDIPNWSSTGDGVRNPDVIAPGSAILSGSMQGAYLPTYFPGAVCYSETDVHVRGTGTSQAAAVTAGAVALLLEQRPDLTPDQVKELLTETAMDFGKNPKQQGHGMVDVAALLAAATPGLEAVQTFPRSTGLGSLHEARGTMLVGEPGDQLTGELTAFGTTWTPGTWAPMAAAGDGWQERWAVDGAWLGATWSGATWSGATWSGATWSGATWSGATWSGATWSGATWSGATWSGATWSGATWSGATWSGATWSGATWTGASWTGASWT